MSIEKKPEWLLDIASGKETQFSLLNVLQNSLYYPGCELNGAPVKCLGGNIHSFIYSDYGVSGNFILNNTNRITNRVNNRCGFKGYRAIKEVALGINDFIPIGWSPEIVPKGEKDLVMARQRHGESFAHWSVLERLSDFPSTHGPDLFSFLYIGGEISAVYQALYIRNNIKPKVLVVITSCVSEDSWGLGSVREDSFFKKVVKANPAGMPDYLIDGHDSIVARWKEYKGEKVIQFPEQAGNLWKLNSRLELS